MKQRLLFALLMLFTSMGFVKAADELTITIPADPNPTKGSVVITVSGGTAPSLTYGGQTKTSITIPQTDAEQAGISLDGVGFESITISGKVTSCTLALSTVKSLSFTGNGVLSTLTVTNATALTTINADGNKLAAVTGLPIACKVIGKQTVDASAVTATAKGVNLLTAASAQLGVLPSSGTYSFTWEKLNTTTNTYASTTEAKKILTNDGNYAFVDANSYYTSGTYRCMVTRGQASVMLEGIKITPALIDIRVIDSPKNGWDEVMGSIANGGITIKDCADQSNSGSHVAASSLYTYHQGDKIQVVATATDVNYVFSKFDKLAGLVGDQPLDGATTTTFEVKAKASAANPSQQEDVTIQAVFNGVLRTINFTPADLNGSFFITDLTDGNKQITDGAQVQHGHKLRITATPDAKFYSKYLISGNGPSGKSTTNADFKATNIAEVYVDQNRSIAVQFIPNATAATTYTFNMVAPTSLTNPDWSAILETIKIGSNQAAVSVPNGSITTPIIHATTDILDADKNIPLVIEVATTHVSDFFIKSIQQGTQELAITSEGNGKYSTTFRASQTTDAAFTITVVDLKGIKVDFEGKGGSDQTLTATTAQSNTYDKTSKPFKYSTDPSNLKLKVFYKPFDATDAAYTTVEPVNAGSYAVKYLREADKVYQEIKETTVTIAGQSGDDAKKVVVITPASVQITKVPTVTAVKQVDNTYKYAIGTNGEAKALGVVALGEFKIIPANTTLTDLAAVASAVPTDVVPGTTSAVSHNAVLRFQVKNGTAVDNNYYCATTTVPVKVGDTELAKYTVTPHADIVTLDGVKATNIPVTVEIYNGANKITGADIATGTKIKLRALVSGYAKVEFVNTAVGSSEKKEATWISGNIYETGEITVDKVLDYSIALTQKLNEVFTMTAKTQSVKYSGEAKVYDVTGSDLVVKQKTNDVTISNKTRIYYKDATGAIVQGAPVNAGKYDVCLDIPMHIDNTPANSYAAQTLVVKEALQIVKKDPAITWPTSTSTIGKGQKLSAATFLGGTVDIAGTFTWKEGETITPETSNQYYTIVFTPSSEYIANYNVMELTADEQRTNQLKYGKLAVSISQDPIISIATVQNGKFVVKSGNAEYHSGNPVVDKTPLMITAVPNDGFEVKSLIVDEVGTAHAIASGATFTINGKSIMITGEFALKETPAEPSEPVIDPSSQYAVKLPSKNAVRGVVVNNPGVNAVTKDKPFSFTLSTLAADASKVVVKANGTELKSVNGVYTMEKVSANTDVTITLAAPTKLNVAVETTTKNVKGYLIGKVQVEGPADGVCYYGDELTLVAYPESGVSFIGWSDDAAVKGQLRTLITTKDVTIKPIFSGVPTGIESVATAQIFSSEGCLVIRGVGEAKLTVVGMDGRIQKHAISGDSRIPMPAGIYGIILEDGTETVRTKVIVK